VLKSAAIAAIPSFFMTLHSIHSEDGPHICGT